MSGDRGFTLIEVMITIAVFVILVSVAVPGFQSLVQNHRATSTANELTTTFHYARTEAVRRGLPVSVCPQDASDWAQGWQVRAAGACATGNSLRDREALAVTIVIDASGAGSDRVTFDGLGARLSDAIQFKVESQGCSGERAREIRIGPGGQVALRQASCS